jgi:NAD(P)-dependent dehydrogenase (short-subunit alcohol dehydrogenase family)
MTCTHRHVVVTGASSGIGRATALRLAGGGWHVYAGVRKPDDGDTLKRSAHPGQLITPLLMDVTNADQIGAAVESVAEHVGYSGLNALVDNAGIGVAVPMELVPLESLRWQLEVNVVGQAAVTQAFLPMLRRARGRVVFIGSIGDRFTPPFGGPLAASKAAIASIADAFRQELAPWGIDVVLLEPASIRTDAIDKLQRDSRNAADEFSPDGRELYGETYLGMVSAALKREQKGSPPDVVAEKVQRVLTMARPGARYLVGKDAQLLANLVRFVPTSALDALRRKIFNLPASGSRAASPVRQGVPR